MFVCITGENMVHMLLTHVWTHFYGTVVNFQEKLIFNIKNGYEQNQGSREKNLLILKKKSCVSNLVGFIYCKQTIF